MYLRNTLLFLSLSLLIFAAYYNSLNVPFQYDDYRWIVHYKDIHIGALNFDELSRLFAEVRPIASISFALNYLAGELNVFGYHLTNIVIHTFSAFGLFLFTFYLVSFFEKENKEKAFAIALFSTLIWAMNPIHTQAVTYIVQRMTSMSAMFYIFSLLFYIKGRVKEGPERLLYISLAVFAFVCSIGTKQIGISLPVVVLLCEFLLFRKGSLKIRKSGPDYLLIILVLLSIALCITYFYSYYFDAYRLNYVGVMSVIKERLFTEARVFFIYMALFLFPLASRLNIEHDIALSRGIITPPETLFAIIAIAGLVLYSFIYFKKKRLNTLLILWMLCCMAVESLFVGIEIMYEHRAYLPFMPFSILAGKMIVERIPRRKIRIVLLTMIVLLFSINTHKRNYVWQDEITLWSDAAGKSPYSMRANSSLGMALGKAGRYGDAINVLLKARQINPRDPAVRYYLGVAYYEKKMYDEAIGEFRAVWRMGFDSPLGAPTIDEFYFRIALVLTKTGYKDKALALLKEAYFFNPENNRVQELIGAIENENK